MHGHDGDSTIDREHLEGPLSAKDPDKSSRSPGAIGERRFLASTRKNRVPLSNDCEKETPKELEWDGEDRGPGRAGAVDENARNGRERTSEEKKV